MQVHFKPQTYLKSSAYFFIGVFLLLLSSLGFAQTIVIKNNTMINKPVSYQNVTLDMTQGQFTINKGGSLTIENSVVNVLVTPSNPFFAYLTNGRLIVRNSTVNVSVSGITPHSNSQSLYQLIPVDQGLVTLTQNTFTVDTAFALGFLKTNPSFLTEGLIINNNTISNFNGGVYLMNSSNAEVNNNTFQNVSFSNIFNNGNLSNFTGNLFSFPGNLMYGDAFDIVNSEGVTISGNIIASSANYGIYIMGGQNLFIDNNKISDGLAYGIFIQTPSLAAINKNKFLAQLMPTYKIKLTPNSNITISNNYIALNRFGLAGETIQNLIVQNNTFIQRFADSGSRQFWTNNNILLSGTTGVTWTNNLYKEAFTQDIEGDNSKSLQFVTFPAQGGVVL